jgi:hypothetical protein
MLAKLQNASERQMHLMNSNVFTNLLSAVQRHNHATLQLATKLRDVFTLSKQIRMYALKNARKILIVQQLKQPKTLQRDASKLFVTKLPSVARELKELTDLIVEINVTFPAIAHKVNLEPFAALTLV